jgi:hypothetical protein
MDNLGVDLCWDGMLEHGERAGRWRIVVAAALLCLAGLSVAEPCSLLLVKHEPDAAERQIDRQPPAQVAGNVARVLRGRRLGSSCNDTSLIEIEITGAKDDCTA